MTQLTPSRLKLKEYAITEHYASIEHGVPFDALLDSAFWAHVSAKLKPGDLIYVRAEDGAYSGELEVLDAGKLYAKVGKIRYTEYEQHEVLEAGPNVGEFGVKFQGPIKKWVVIRDSDKAVLKEGMSKAEALLWIANHKQALAA